MNVTQPAADEPLARLEARVRWLTALCAFLTLGLLSVAAWQFAPRPKVVEAHAFVLRDQQWRRRGEFSVREDGSPILRLNSAKGRERVVLSVREGGRTMVRLTDSQDVFRARLELDAQGAPLLSMSDARGKAVWAAP
ncbi:MAG TPA: hypothetical protein VFQ05_04315 [Candidatus Eisenbacteria bacterium]|nr:hypothetical protein [Candidatus Eisenbacteria bacterium]